MKVKVAGWDLDSIEERRKKLLEWHAKVDTIEASEDSKVLMWKKIVNELDALENLEELIQKKIQIYQKYGQEYAKACERSELEQEIKREVSMIKAFFGWGMPQEKIVSELKFLIHDKVIGNLESNLTYIKEHINDSNSNICDQLGLIGELSSEI